MPSLSNKIIRGKEISEKKLISPPLIEDFYKEEIEKISNITKKDLDISEIYRNIEHEAEEKGKIILKEYEEKGKDIVEASKIEANNILENAREEGEQKGYKIGYQDGYTYGINEAKNEYESIIKEAKEIRQKAKEFIENSYLKSRDYVSSVENEIIQIIIDVSRKVINTELTQNDESIVSILEPALLKCIGKKQIIIKLSPKNSIVVKREKGKLMSSIDEECNILILADGDVNDDEFKIETPSEFIDSSVEMQLNTLLQTLLGEDERCTK